MSVRIKGQPNMSVHKNKKQITDKYRKMRRKLRNKARKHSTGKK